MTPIVLSTLNATYQHASFGLRYLHANLGDLKPLAAIAEFTLQQKPKEVVEALLAYQPQIIGLGVYIWNVAQTTEVVSLLKIVAPEVKIVLGGPEVSYEAEGQPICTAADYIVQGEGEFAFRDLARQILGGNPPNGRFVPATLPNIEKLALPYELYTDEDIAHRILYVEASRGCPYKCEFCLSSLDTAVRNFPLDSFLSAIQRLIDRGARRFKFVDRTFNLSPTISSRILDFFLERIELGLFLHFELVPDRLPDSLKDRIARFPPGSLQFEIGVQTWSPDVAARISRRQRYDLVQANFRFLREHTHAHIHADLIVGLPGETLDSFGAGFDALSELEPHEIQVGILKRLKGTPIIRHDHEWAMAYQNFPPFTVIQTKTMPFHEVAAMERFAKFYDLCVNSGRFPKTIGLLKERAGKSWFWTWWDVSAYLNRRHPQRHSIALVNLAESLWRYLVEDSNQELSISEALATEKILSDYCGEGKRDVPHFLKKEQLKTLTRTSASSVPSRQLRFLEGHSP